ncbi:hypothetical protein ACFFGH_34275 [Lysobacter korlensis]|uniref:Uncharacterized protein n=1 Tax=Lysobacter korlensis TaxID=553636 RepID=A0ABV6S127_9GAMM
MISDFIGWIQFRTWLELACFAAGLAVLLPLTVSGRLRRRLARLDSDDVQAVGLVVLVLAVIGVGLYNRFGAGFGA